MTAVSPPSLLIRSQDLEHAYYECGPFNLWRIEHLQQLQLVGEVVLEPQLDALEAGGAGDRRVPPLEVGEDVGLAAPEGVGQMGGTDAPQPGGVIGLRPSIPTESVGAPGVEFNNAYLTGSLITPSIEGPSAGGPITVRDPLNPSSDGIFLGTSTNRWNSNLYDVNVFNVVRAARTDGLVVVPPASGTGSDPNQTLHLDQTTGQPNGQNKSFFKFSTGGNSFVLDAGEGALKYGAIKVTINGAGDKWIRIWEGPT
jgi:hypothetical protein